MADQATDGNTLEIQGQRVRGFGINAFAQRQTCLDARGEPWRCGAAAAAALGELIQDHGIACTVVDEDDAVQYVARCTARGEVDVGSYMVSVGLALADRRASDEYAADEAAARRAGTGAWAGLSPSDGTGASNRPAPDRPVAATTRSVETGRWIALG